MSPWRKGAKPGERFVDYVDYLDAKNYVPPDGKPWVDRIRKLGNGANHELPEMTPEQARGEWYEFSAEIRDWFAEKQDIDVQERNDAMPLTMKNGGDTLK